MSGIQIENLVKTYGDNIAVNGLNLNLEKGKVYGFLGQTEQVNQLQEHHYRLYWSNRRNGKN